MKMAGIPVNNNLNALSNIVAQAASGQDGRSMLPKQEEALEDSFHMVMDRMNAKAGSQMAVQGKSQTLSKVQPAFDTKSVSAGTAGTNASNDAKKVTVKEDAAEADTVKADSEKTGTEKADPEKAGTEKADTEKTDEEAEQTVENEGKDTVQAKDDAAGGEISESTEDTLIKAGEQLVADIAQEMGVTTDEVLEAMEVLGLSAVQLLEPENMKLLLVELSGKEDMLSIVTDGELYAHFKNLTETLAESLDELAAELGISKEEVNVLVENMTVQTQPEESVLPEENLMPGENPMPEEEAEDVNLIGTKDYAVTVHKDGETVAVKVKVDDASGAESAKEEVVQTPVIQSRHDAKSGNKNAFAEGREEGHTAGNFMAEQPALQTDSVQPAEQTPVMERFISTEDIMNQIMEYMKINVKEGVQEMELQLHPASLGTVNVQIAAKDGVITAQFTAQNETVKAAIETQLLQLKNQFEEQGIKVDSVEVAVADYRFENSFSGGQEETQGRDHDAKKGRRRINLNEVGLEELPEDMDDADRIAAEMMAGSGNTVDYMA